MRRRHPLAAALGAAFVLLAAACGGGGDDDADIALTSADGMVFEGDLDTPESTPADGATGATEADDASDGTAVSDDPEATPDTIPLNEDDDVAGTMFEALNTFNTCLEDLGTAFLGDPRGAEEGSPAADPSYIENLSTCAARSNILEAMESMNAANEALGPEEIEERNRGIQRWAECMQGRGWTVDLTPDDRGMLNPTGMTGPDGDGGIDGFLDNDDMEDCADESQAEIESDGGEGEAG